MEFLNELNESQRKAVEYVDGASLVIAGAGSGKTRVLTYKIAYLLKKGIHPTSILALTFTNKAAREMKERIAQMVGERTARYLWMGTFHSVFSRILRAEAEKTGYSKNFSIYDSSDSNSLIKSIVKDLKIDEKTYKAGLVHSRISFAKNNLITPDAYRGNTDLLKADMYSKVPRIVDVYDIYTQRCKLADAMDFDDLLLQTNILFRNHPDVLQKYRNAFSYILVDEYQDTNFAQYLIVRKLSEQHERICVVGDDAQSIYSFRGANIDNILKFKNSYSNAQVFKLEQNYRSTQTIVNAANSLIDKNSEQIRKNVFSEKEKGNLIKLLSTFTDLEEGVVVADSINQLRRKQGYSYQNIAILYRTNSQSRVLEEALRKKAIPYRIYGGLSFYQRKEIKDVIAYCRLINNHNDEEAIKRIINVPARGIGDTTVGKLTECAQTHAVSIWDVLQDMLAYNLAVNAGTATKLAGFRKMISFFASQSDSLNAYELVMQIVKMTGIINDTYVDKSPEAMSRQENVQELLKAIHEFCEQRVTAGESANIGDFLSEVSLLTDQDNTDDANTEKVTMMTVHAAKGLEFKAVFIVGMEEDLFPSAYAFESERSLEEERRLFYVAITRAEEQCFISFSKSRFRNGKTTNSNPSRFIKDIDPQYLDAPEEKVQPSWLQRQDESFDFEFERKSFQHQSFSSSKVTKPVERQTAQKLIKIAAREQGTKQVVENKNLPVGAFVKHAVFGIGKVLETTIADGNEKAEIDFGEKGKKSLLLKFAKLELL
ncbi:MAG: UvrD-helicase domain-containing protein [Paludibacteraceae bacterium]|nr:UvrD-helicase domain-containing protein [Paludibacteraceae bacterium]